MPDRIVDLIFGPLRYLRSGDGSAKRSEHGPGVEPARHDGRDEVGSHSLHNLVGRCDPGDVVPA